MIKVLENKLYISSLEIFRPNYCMNSREKLLIILFINLFSLNLAVLAPVERNTNVCKLQDYDELFLEIKLKKLKRLNIQAQKVMKESILLASAEHDLSVRLIFSLIQSESSFNPEAVSTVGAKGLTQLMPQTATKFCKMPESQIFEINQNINCGSKYLKRLLNDFNGDLKLALAAYNTGPSRIRSLKKRNYTEVKPYISRQTKAYVLAIEKSYLQTV